MVYFLDGGAVVTQKLSFFVGVGAVVFLSQGAIQARTGTACTAIVCESGGPWVRFDA